MQIFRQNANLRRYQRSSRLEVLTTCYNSIFSSPVADTFEQQGITYNKYFIDICKRYASIKNIDLIAFLETMTSDNRHCRSGKYPCEVERREAKRRQDRKASIKTRLKAKANEILLINQIDYLSKLLTNYFVLFNEAGEWIEPQRIFTVMCVKIE